MSSTIWAVLTHCSCMYLVRFLHILREVVDVSKAVWRQSLSSSTEPEDQLSWRHDQSSSNLASLLRHPRVSMMSQPKWCNFSRTTEHLRSEKREDPASGPVSRRTVVTYNLQYMHLTSRMCIVKIFRCALLALHYAYSKFNGTNEWCTLLVITFSVHIKRNLWNFVKRVVAIQCWHQQHGATLRVHRNLSRRWNFHL